MTRVRISDFLTSIHADNSKIPETVVSGLSSQDSYYMKHVVSLGIEIRSYFAIPNEGGTDENHGEMFHSSTSMSLHFSL